MLKRTTVEIDDELLTRAKRALSVKTTRAAIEEALRRAAAGVESELEQQASRQKEYLNRLSVRLDTKTLDSEEMWR